MDRVALVLDRTEAEPGAVGLDGTSELALHSHTAASAVAALEEAGVEAGVVHARDGERPLDLSARVDEWGATAVVVLRFGSGDPSHPASAWTVGLHWPGSRRGRDLAEAVARSVSTTLGTPAHGPSPRRVDPDGQLLDLVRTTRGPCVMLVTHGGRVREDHTRAVTAAQDGSLGRAVAQGVLQWLGRR